VDDWRRMLSIMAPGSADKLPDIENFSAQMFTPMRQACGSLIVSSLSETDVDSRFRVACDPVAPGISIPGGQDLRWEVGIYRFVRTSEALYQIHYVEHGSEALSSSKREQIFSDAAVAVNNVLICRLSDPHPCPPLDRYTLGAIPQSVAGEPPCRSNDSTPCNPAVIFSAPAAQTLTTDETAKKALMVLDFSKEDLLSIERLSHYAGTIIKNLKDGRPGATLIIRGPNPDYSVTTKDRVRVGTFLMVLRSVLIKQGVVDPNAMRFTFMNFR